MDKIMLVTGGSRGIGAATCLMAAKHGYAVAVNYHSNREAADAVVAAIEKDGGKALAIQADVADEQDVVRLFATVDDKLGRITALVNNAGIVDQPAKVADMAAERVARMMSVNVVGPFLCAREAIRRMGTSYGGPGGVIVNVSSAASHAAGSGGANTYIDYGASKGAIDTFTEGLAKEVAPEQIRVSAVRPGVVDTEIHASGGLPDKPEQAKSVIPLGRVGQPEDIAEAILYLSEAQFTTGAFLDVDGGV
ncbi:SDR family oxidoreductase [Salinisphaera sp.]|uniref:SDR family oxidoreductase n=1 Tax=Salinisphaera sp. TaxID=1914330 RepID=UPI000C35B292|nr:SDR family oxidoreductase [Salinisphaera sp.]MAS08510.1 NAD(P)-dependent oxidoreductase [Salinisphaera sp.]|tara:strand:- start:76 stop:825 length:750 start_codon:yes stop_codon:yes gene_type:complete